MFESLLDQLQRSNPIRWQILIYLYFSGTYKCVVNMCHLAYATAADSPTFGYAHGHHIYQSSYNSLKRLATKGKSKKVLEDANQNYASWCLPPLLPWMEWYQRLSMVVLIYVTLINSLPLEQYLELLLGPLERPIHCYVPGRLVLYSTLPQKTALGVALIHITWHLSMYHKFKQFDLNMVAFMIQDDELILREHRKIAKQLELRGNKGGFNNYQFYLSNILYHPNRFRGRDVYILRPNRTHQARRIVAQFIAKCSLISGSVLGILAIVGTPIIISSVLRDQAYLDRYPGCSPKLEQERQLGRLSWWGSISIWGHWHKIISNTVDILENWVLWFDSGAAIAITLSFTYLFNYDFLYYWSQIAQKLNHLDLLLKFKWVTSEINGDEDDQRTVINEEQKDEGLSEPDWYQYAESFRHRRPHMSNFLRTRRPSIGVFLPEDVSEISQQLINNKSETSYSRKQTKSDPGSEEMISLLQAQLIDFFLQLRAVDRLVSEIVTFSVIIWLCIFTFGTIYFLMNGSNLVAVELRIIQALAIITLSIENMFLLALRRTLNHSYKTVCSIMAYDQSRLKYRFAKILDYWSGRHGANSWTLLHRYAFTSTTSLTLVGWSVSFVMISDNFFGRRHL